MQPVSIANLCLFATAFLASLATTPLAKRFAIRVGSIDHPDARRINTKPIPRMGGIAIFLGIVAAFITQYLGTTFLNWPIVLVPSPRLVVDYWMLVAAFCIIFAVGAIDDIRGLKPMHKFLGQAIGASVAVAGGLVIGVIVNPFDPRAALELGWIAYPATVLYLVAYINIINLIDGLDGLAAGIALISSLTMFLLSSISGRLDAAALAIAVAGASAGFLPYNFHPASIFMGDCGSHVLGFALGAISLLSVTRVAGLTTVILPLVIAGIPIIDTFSAIVRRRRAHVSVGQADKGHIHHRLLAEGFNQRQTVIAIYLWTALLCGGALLMNQLELVPRIVTFFVLLVGSALLSFKLRLFEPVLLHHYHPNTGQDELVVPADDGFEDEIEAFERDRSSHHRSE